LEKKKENKDDDESDDNEKNEKIKKKGLKISHNKHLIYYVINKYLLIIFKNF
jgi:hypothetical protein